LASVPPPFNTPASPSSYAGRAALERRQVHIPDLRGRKTDFLRSPEFAAEGFISYFGLPLIAKGQVRGVLEIFHRAPLDPDREWLDFMEAHKFYLWPLYQTLSMKTLSNSRCEKAIRHLVRSFNAHDPPFKDVEF
jgi:hypothetical protein